MIAVNTVRCHSWIMLKIKLISVPEIHIFYVLLCFCLDVEGANVMMTQRWLRKYWFNTQKKNINWKRIFFHSARHKRFFSWKKRKKRKFIWPKMKKKKNSFNYFFSLEKKVSWKKRVHWFFLHCVWHMENNVFIYHLYSMFLWKQFFPPIMISFLSLFHGKKIHLARNMNKNFLWILLIHNINYSIFCAVQNMTKIVIFFPYTVTVHLFFEKSKKKNCDKTNENFFFRIFFHLKKNSHEKKSLVCSVGN